MKYDILQFYRTLKPRRLSAIGLIWLLLLPSVLLVRDTKALIKTMAPYFQAALDRVVQVENFIGVSAAIAFPGGQIWAGSSGYSLPAARDTITSNMLFAAGSITKTCIYSVWSAGALWTTPADLARWGQRLYSGALLEDDELEAMLRFYSIPKKHFIQKFHNGTDYGLTAIRFLFSDTVLRGHRGNVLSFNASMVYLPEEKICITALVKVVFLPLLTRIYQTLLDIYLKYRNEPFDSARSTFKKRHPAERPELSQNHSHPFNPSTTICYNLPHTARVALTIYNNLGETVCVLVNAKQSAGAQIIRWDGKNKSGQPVAAGVYMCQLEMDRQVIFKKMMLLK